MAKSKYEELMPVVLKNLEEGYTYEESARRAGIAHRTLYDWMKAYPHFMQAVQRARKDGERNAIGQVENSLLSLALGFEYEEVTTEYESQPNPDKKSNEKYIPVIKKQRRVKKRVVQSVEAIKFYLTNKAPEQWKNRLEQNNIGNVVTDLKVRYITASPDDVNFPSSEDEVEV